VHNVNENLHVKYLCAFQLSRDTGSFLSVSKRSLFIKIQDKYSLYSYLGARFNKGQAYKDVIVCDVQILQSSTHLCRVCLNSGNLMPT
jgi:hypothetical protein